MTHRKLNTIIYLTVNILLVVLFSTISIGIYNKKQEVQIQYKGFPNKYIGEFSITHYCSCPKCTGTPKGSRTSVGHLPKEGRTIAVDKKVIPLHSVVYIEGLGYFVAEDTGGAIKKNHIDIYVDNHERAVQLGTLNGKKKKVYIMEEK